MEAILSNMLSRDCKRARCHMKGFSLFAIYVKSDNNKFWAVFLPKPFKSQEQSAGRALVVLVSKQT